MAIFRTLHTSMDWTDECTRCGYSLREALISALENGTEMVCWRCGLEIPLPSNVWLVANGYNVPDEEE